jgi:peptidoglycan/LPS O-acetylase OafA/YrhL
MTKNASFRSDIEGLRALAVLVVLAFHHKWASCFGGGFVGVDVFFVISGYLITRNILTKATRDEFSFSDFYIRRVRRLFPALFITIALTVTMGIFVSSPADLQNIGESAIASIFSVSNFYFWSLSGYFDSAAIQKPLLHTWSLAVEEQFYLVWPVVVVLLARHLNNRKHAIAALTVLGALSVCATEVALGNDTAGAFYLTPYRIGEFAVGAICAWLPDRSPIQGWMRDALVLLGIGLILYAVFGYSDATHFPGLTALVPCLGAALLIRFGDKSVARPLLANRIAVGIGRISYSLYLVHWPVYVFFRQWYGSDPGVAKSVAFSAISLLLAMAMYRFVEQPYRIRGDSVGAKAISTRSFIKLFAGLAACLITTSVLIWYGQGWAWRFPNDLSKLAQEAEAEKQARFDHYRERCLAKNSVSCDEPTDGVNVFIVGDSHAPDAFNALVTQYPRYHYVVQGLAGCPPLVREDNNLLTVKHPDRDGCIARNEKLLYSDQLSRADIVVINTVFSWYKPEHLERSIAQIRKHTSAPIVVLGNYLFFDQDVPDMVIRHGSTVMDVFYEKNLAWHSFAFDDELKDLSVKLDFIYISKRQLLCKGDSVFDCPLMIGDKLFTYDRHHFSMAAARKMGLSLKTMYNEHFVGIETQKIAKKYHETFN